MDMIMLYVPKEGDGISTITTGRPRFLRVTILCPFYICIQRRQPMTKNKNDVGCFGRWLNTNSF